MIHRVTPGSFGSSMRSSRSVTPANEREVRRNDEESSKENFGLGRILQEDLTPFGKIPLIIKGEGKEKSKELRGIIAKEFHPEQAEAKENLDLVDGLKVEVDPYNLERLLKTLPNDSQVMIDSKIRYPLQDNVIPKIPEPEEERRPVLDISRSTLGINRLWEQGFTGKGVGICVIDSGLHPHQDLDGRIVAFADMNEGRKKPYDPYGHGTHVAGIAAGTGAASEGVFMGVAPDAHLVGVRITSVSEAIKGIQWAIENKDKYDIKVINMSLGDFPMRSWKDDPWAQAAEKAWDAGIVVVVAAGNEGPSKGSISTPGIAPSVITVGAIDDKNTPQRDDDRIADFTSRGPTTPDGLGKPDLVAPGVEIYGPLVPNSKLDNPDLPRVGNEYLAISGTSQATPLVSGVAALLIQANPDLTNNEIKEILVSTAEDYLPRVNPYDQGAGLLDPMESLEVALRLRQEKGGDPTSIDNFEKKEVVPMHIAREHPKNPSSTTQA